MGQIYIHYGNLEDSINKSRKVRGELNGYIEEIKKRVTSPISALPGNDSSGYTSTASSLAWQKINKLNSKSSRFLAYETSVSNFIAEAKIKDNNVSSRMETIAGMYVEKRTWYQKAGDWFYETFCVDVANNWEWTRKFADTAKWVQDKLGNIREKVADWFKYGDGKYVLNIISAVGASVAAIGATVLAIVSIPFTGGATLPIVIGCIGAAATAIGSVITVVNSVSKIKNNKKAIGLSGNLLDDTDGDVGAARYYGNVEKLSDEWRKTDMGDAATNAKFEKRGKIIDTTKVVADTTAFVCNIINSAGAVRDYRFKNPDAHIKRYEFSMKNLKHNLRGEFGLYLTKPGFQIKNLTKMKKTINDFKNAIDFFGGKKEEFDNIWSNDNKPSKPATSSDPFGELETAWNNIISPIEIFKKATQ